MSGKIRAVYCAPAIITLKLMIIVDNSIINVINISKLVRIINYTYRIEILIMFVVLHG